MLFFSGSRAATRLLLFACCLAVLIVGCGSSQDGFVVTDNNGSNLFNLTVGADPAALARGDIRAQIGVDAVQFRVTVFDIFTNQVGQKTISRTGRAVFALPNAVYLVRVEGLDAGNNVVGYFDRVVFGEADFTYLIPGLQMTTTPPPPDTQGTQNAPPFFIFTSTPTTNEGGTAFNVTARVYDGVGTPSTSVTTGVSLVSNGVAFAAAPPNQDTDASGIVTFTGLTYPTTASGTATLTVNATGVDAANSGNITVTAAPVVFGFTPGLGSPFPAGNVPRSLAVGDFDGSNGPDLAVANQVGNNVTLLLNDGTGRFTHGTGSPFAVGTNPFSVGAGDFDGINGLDLAVAGRFNGDVTVLLNDGTGGFTPGAGSPFAAGSDATALAVGDFDGVNGPDLAVVNTNINRVRVLLNDGTGGFSAGVGSPFTVGTTPNFVAVGDLDGANGLDLVVVNSASNNVTVLLNDGAGSFSPSAGGPLAVGTGPTSVGVGDFDGLNGLDLAVTNFIGGDVTLLLNDGAGGFTPGTGSPFTVGDRPTAVGFGDFDGANGLDLAVANGLSNDVTVLLNDGSGGFTPGTGSPFGVGLGPNSIGVADFDGVRGLDLALSEVTGNVTVLLHD